MASRLRLTYEPASSPEDFEALGRVLAECFPAGFVGDAARDWPQRERQECVRVVRHRRRIVAGLVSLPVAQWFGGAAVPTAAIRLVGVAPEWRRRGVAAFLMQRVLEEARDSGLPLSTLYPATQTLYRRVGYEHAGLNMGLELTPRDLWHAGQGGGVERLDRSDVAALDALHRAVGRTTPGWMCRDAWMWGRILRPRAGGQVLEAHGFGVRNAAGDLDGYAITALRPRPDVLYDVMVTDAVARTAETGGALLAHLASHASMAANIVWRVSLGSPLLALPPEVCWRVRDVVTWMVRITDVRTALAARGYPDMRAELHLDVRDDLLPANHGRFVLAVDGGEGKVRKGGRGTLRMGARGLATLFTGYRSAEALRAAGALEGSPAALRLASRVFASPSPWMTDFF